MHRYDWKRPRQRSRLRNIWQVRSRPRIYIHKPAGVEADSKIWVFAQHVQAHTDLYTAPRAVTHTRETTRERNFHTGRYIHIRTCVYTIPHARIYTYSIRERRRRQVCQVGFLPGTCGALRLLYKKTRRARTRPRIYNTHRGPEEPALATREYM